MGNLRALWTACQSIEESNPELQPDITADPSSADENGRMLLVTVPPPALQRPRPVKQPVGVVPPPGSQTCKLKAALPKDKVKASCCIYERLWATTEPRVCGCRSMRWRRGYQCPNERWKRRHPTKPMLILNGKILSCCKRSMTTVLSDRRLSIRAQQLQSLRLRCPTDTFTPPIHILAGILHLTAKRVMKVCMTVSPC